jgi:hypothetical protein
MGRHSVKVAVVVKLDDNGTGLGKEPRMPIDGEPPHADRPEFDDPDLDDHDLDHSFNDPPAAESTAWESEEHAWDEIADAGDDRDAADRGSAVESYWTLSRAPLESMVFSLPLVLIYEAGVLLLGRETPRNGADVWLRSMLDAIGFGAYFLLPLATILGLLAWHHVQHDRWRFSGRVLVGMACESLLLACVLIGLARLQEELWPGLIPLAQVHLAQVHVAEAESDLDVGLQIEPFSADPMTVAMLRRLVGFCGAGLYEEVLFRLLLMPVLAWLLVRLGFSPSMAAAGGVLCSAVLFSAAHYVGALGDTFDLYSFTFRTVAGIFFGMLFFVRGFGITAGTHAAYDVLVGLV